ncbi:hypothetical protein WICANDRAFT_61966 [Wickerhamomyces anomalus NRRL Y-366-8]|uniref:Sugar phosphate phosphatase n=1 Tax=Wickerhamomyces anomalus (strain ATCC 58044 / CBS 1984 / NCYC 433 / NRRL Y-366-8) TaxID=683960 RepID=A0A1E3P7R9_WICAA|nr:uncharacterized protein WICANDRAFT_61966 [Wickerhamomyces anomalus NRRL Y-366-8]ODQ61408.1 hypothetical protein WICANDRAFT_61966 [Wickerhamomyces anomalus NRRL Y-366-8]
MSNLPDVYYNKDSDSFAFSTARTRWIKIIQDAIDDVASAVKNSSDAEFKKQGEQIESELKQLKNDVQSDGAVKPFQHPTNKAFASFDKVLKGQNYTWLTGPWLFLENYLYRVINSFFISKSLWFNYDIFDNLKRSSFESSVAGVVELAIRYYKLTEEVNSIDEQTKQILFNEFAEISLWGNATDLSLLATATLEDIKSIQGAEARKKSEANILDNDLDEAWKQLTTSKDEVKRVDFVLDNAGFEVYTDLIFALFLLDLKLTDEVVFHTKDIPWMVSDVNIKDFYILLADLKNTTLFPEHRKELDHFINKIEYFNNNGTLQLRTSPFWTLDLDFWNIDPKEVEFGGAKVHKDLSDSSLVIFKGDMNYRKLTGDRRWPSTTTFAESIGPLASNGLKILALRTIKADVLVGLQEGVYDQVGDFWEKDHDSRLSWLSSGKYAVISYSNGSN